MRYLAFQYDIVTGETTYIGDFAEVPTDDTDGPIVTYQLTDRNATEAKKLARRFNINLENIDI